MILTTPVHLRLGTAREKKAEKLAMRAVLVAARLLGVATGTHLRHLRDSTDLLTTLQARLQEAVLRAHLAWEAASLLRSRFPNRRLPPRPEAPAPPHRFASTDSILATARLERFWRTLKETASLYGLLLPLTREDLERRLELPLLHYLCFRPHEGLRGATPAEAFLGATPAHEAAAEPPRARPGEGLAQAPFVIDYLDPAKRRFPVLKRAA